MLMGRLLWQQSEARGRRQDPPPDIRSCGVTTARACHGGGGGGGHPVHTCAGMGCMPALLRLAVPKRAGSPGGEGPGRLTQLCNAC